MPVCVWRAGKVAAALRKGSVSCLQRLLEFKLVTADVLVSALGSGFEPGPLEPVLKSCLDDDDADIRFMTCGILRSLFMAVEGRLDSEQVLLLPARPARTLLPAARCVSCRQHLHPVPCLMRRGRAWHLAERTVG